MFVEKNILILSFTSRTTETRRESGDRHRKILTSSFFAVSVFSSNFHLDRSKHFDAGSRRSFLRGNKKPARHCNDTYLLLL